MYELDAPLFEMAAAIEGHPDNVAAALIGGFVICAGDTPARFEPAPGLEGVHRHPARCGAHRAGARGAAGGGPDW